MYSTSTKTANTETSLGLTSSIPIVEFGNGIKKYWVCCQNEKCRIQPTTDAHKTKGVVVREWNKRFIPKEENEQ